MKKSLKKIWQSKKMVVTLHSQKGNNPSHPALWCNGSTSDSGSACEGSNPSKATTKGKS